MARRKFFAVSCFALLLLCVVASPLAIASDFVSTTFPASYPWAVAAGDFNGDGKIDLVTVSYAASNNLQVFLNNGAGVFTLKATYSVGSGIYSVVVADFNGDGKLDIAVVGYASNSVTVLFGVGDGTFTAPTNYTVGISHPTWIAVGDFNGDGKPDLVVANSGANNVAVLLNTCSGTCPTPSFAAATAYSVTGAPYGITVGDFNGDGKLDLAVSTSSSVVNVLLGKGDGTFSPSVTYPTGSNPGGGVATADVNGDGKLDLVTANYGAGSISVLLGNGDGTFQAKTDYAAGSSPQGIVIGDFNWDGKPDVAVANGSGSVSLLRGNGNGTFQPAVTYGIALSSPPNLVAADLNGDGRPDLAVATEGSTGALLLNNVLPPATLGQSSLPASDYASAGTGPGFAAAGDFNGDGKLDVAVPNYGSGNVGVLLGNGDGTIQPAVTYPAGTHPYSAATGDFNGDGKLDLAVANFGDNAIGVLLGNGDGSFRAAVPYPVGTGPVRVIVGDFNGDGKPDLAACNQTSNNVSILLGNGDGSFQTAANYNVGVTPNGLALGDFNHDGKQDLVVANFGTNNISVLLGNGNGTFQSAVNYAAATNPIAVVAGDFNNDGKLDIAVANYGSNNISVLLGKGDGTFNAAVNYPAGTNPYSIALAEINGDGKPDLVVSDVTGNNISVLMGKGDGTFNAAVSYPASSQSNPAPRSVIPADLNGDGKPDLVVSNYGANTVSVLLNAGGTAMTTSTPGTSVVGQSVTFTTPVAHKLGTATPNGTVQFQEGTSTLTTAALDGSGTASYTTSALALGTHTISALYSGDAAFYPNTAPQVSQTVSKASTITQITSATPNPTLPNTSVTYYVSVLVASPGAGTATGTVTLTDNGTTQPGCSTPGGALGTAALNGSAQASLTALMGNKNIRNITATYSGDGNFLTSTSVIYQEDVRYASSTALTSSTPTSNYGDAVTFTATVSSSSGSPTGSVSFTDTTRSLFLGTATLSGGVANLTTTALGAGTHNVTATYTGDCNYTTSTSSAASQTVSPVAGAISLYSAMNPSFLKRASTFDAAITPNTATGAVTFSDGGSTLGTAPVINGVAQFSTLTLAAGTHSISASYSGDANVGGVATGPITQTVTRALFPVVQTFAAGTYPHAVVTADFNGDGKPDVAVADIGTYSSDCGCEPTSVTVLMGKGDSTFLPGVSYPLTPAGGYTTANQLGIAAADLNGDGKIDLVISDQVNSNVSVLLGNGDGTFRSAVAYSAGGTHPYGVAIGDVNGDGRPDIVLANFDSNNVSVLLGKGDGTFFPAVTYAAGTNPAYVAIGDFNKDGKLDLAVANYGSNNVSILLSNGSGGFQTAVNYATNANPFAIVAADFDDDGKLDLATANQGSNDVSVLMGNGNGGFQAPVNYHTGMNPVSLAAADMNGDGKPDLVVTNMSGNSVSVLLGNGNGTFQTASTFGAPLPPASWFISGLAVGDFNSDGKLDVVVASQGTNNVDLMLGYGDGTLNARRSNSAGNIGGNVSAMGFGDLNGDGKLDVSLAYIQTNNANLIVEQGYGNGNFAEPASYYSTSVKSFMILGDFNGDGKPDQALAVWAYNSVNALFISLGNGSGNFNYLAMYNIGPLPPYDMPVDMVVGDFNNDGKLDIAVLERVGYTGGSNYVAVLLGDGTGHFSGPVNYGVGSIPMGLAVGDFNHDGKLDIAVVNQGDNTIGVLYGNGNGTFQAMVAVVSLGTNSNASGIAAPDLNGDGYADLVVSRMFPYPTRSLSVFLNNGSGGFQSSADYPAPGPVNSIKAADLNGDGKLDVITDMGTVLVGNGDGSFQPLVNYDFSGNSIGLGDFNNDGALDAISVVGYFGYVTVMPNLRGSIMSATFPSQSNLGQTVNLPVTVSAGVNKWETPTGTVMVKDGATVLGSATLSNGQASISTTFVNAGSRSLTVSYSGDTAFNPTATTIAEFVSALPAAISTSFGAASIPLNGSTSLSFTVQNTNATTTLTGIGFSNTLPAGLVISTPNGLTGSCGGGTIIATQGTSVISLFGASLGQSASCTFSVNVKGIAAGDQNNTTGAVTSTEGGTGGTASATIMVIAPPSIAAVFNPAPIALNATTSLMFTVTNPATNATALTGVAFTDTLPSGLTVAGSSGAACGGTLTTTAPSGIALAGATIASNSQCQFSVTVTGGTSGNYNVATGTVTSANGGAGNSSNASLTVTSPVVMTSPTAGSTLPGASVTFTWSSDPGSTLYWMWIGTSPGGMELYNQGQGLNTSAVVNGLPTNGAAVYVRLFAVLNGAWQFNDYSYTATSSTKAAMTSPASGSTLPGALATFNWSVGAGAQQYWLWIGTAPGGVDLYNQGQGLNTSATVNGLPTTGASVYVRLFTVLNGTWQWNDYTYTAASSVAATMTSPAPGSTLPGASATFNWSPSAGSTLYWIWIGTTPGGMDLYNQGQSLNTSSVVNGLPTNGSNVYVRLFTVLNGAWQWNDYTYTAAASSKAVMSTPAPATTLLGSSVTFNWSAGSGAQQYWIWIGTAPGGMDLYNQGQGLNTSAVVNSLPTNGTPVYVRLFTVLNGAWQWNDYTYTATSSVKAAMTSPAPGSTLPGASANFSWSLGIGAQQYWIWIGTTPGGMEIYNQGQGLNTSAIVNGLPTNGAPVYVRLFTVLNGAWQWNDYTYTAAQQ